MAEPDPTGPSLDEEGIPDLEGPLPEKAATGDPQEGASPPSDRPASLDFGTTNVEQRAGESFDRRLAREEPDFSDPAYEPPRERFTTVGVEDEAVGRIDDEKDLVAREVEQGGLGLSPEEAALHIEDELD